MVRFIYPPRDTFTTLTADKLVCSIIDAVDDNLQLRRAGSNKLVITGSANLAYQHWMLGGGVDVMDFSANVLLSHDGAGNIDAIAQIDDDLEVSAEVKCNDYNNLSGTYTRLRCNDAIILYVYESAGTTFVALDKIAANQGLDGSRFVVVDNAAQDSLVIEADGDTEIAKNQNIITLGEVTGELNTPDDSFEVDLNADELAPSAQSGTLTELEGYWFVNADDVLYQHLNTILNYLMAKGNVYLQDIIVYFNTTHNDAYIQGIELRRIPNNSASATLVASNYDAHGSGSTGEASYALVCDHAILQNNRYRVSYNGIVTSGSLTIRGIKLVYKLT